MPRQTLAVRLQPNLWSSGSRNRHQTKIRQETSENYKNRTVAASRFRFRRSRQQQRHGGSDDCGCCWPDLSVSCDNYDLGETLTIRLQPYETLCCALAIDTPLRGLLILPVQINPIPASKSKKQARTR
uniref:Uncharacterized protein n=1 Tax=Oryza sativa subsp. japonica TaxID=39947 RepID=Q75G51_ORYSJ|nr:unknown protein [Oryza sativa Japonica Group]